jgi:hypothetical protein
MLSEEQGFETAEPRTANPGVPWAAAARYDRKSRRIAVLLSNGLELNIPVKLAPGLAGERAADLEEIEISPAGLVLHWPQLNVDLYLPVLISGVFGPPENRWNAYWSSWEDKPQRSGAESQWVAADKVPTQLLRR